MANTPRSLDSPPAGLPPQDYLRIAGYLALTLAAFCLPLVIGFVGLILVALLFVL